MGTIMSYVYRKKDKKILFLGLENTGKTAYLSIIRKLFLQPPFEPLLQPTLGFNTLQITQPSNFTIWDLGGSETVRVYWKCYFASVKGVVYFIDISNIEKREQSLQILKNLLDDLKSCVYLVILSKKDLGDKIKAEDDINAIMEGKRYKICETTSFDAIGVKNSFLWLCNEL